MYIYVYIYTYISDLQPKFFMRRCHLVLVHMLTPGTWLKITTSWLLFNHVFLGVCLWHNMRLNLACYTLAYTWIGNSPFHSTAT